MKRVDATNPESYFAERAPRYAAALRGCPFARVLDLLPYIAAIQLIDQRGGSPLHACDAFGGTGFLAKSLSNERMDFVVVDCCGGMLTEANALRRIVTRDDFRDLAESRDRPSFAFVACHGGLHHVIDVEPDGVPSAHRSIHRQAAIARRLASLVQPGGVLVLADIPEGVTSNQQGPFLDQRIDWIEVQRVLGQDARLRLHDLVSLDLDTGVSLRDVAAYVTSSLAASVPYAVPRHFFDQYVARSTNLGHVAVYPRFEALDQAVSEAGLILAGRINFRAPWVFTNANEAGWFFREKFSVDDAGPLGRYPESERRMFEVVQQFLGVRELPDRCCVNWGVTYAAYTRPAAG